MERYGTYISETSSGSRNLAGVGNKHEIYAAAFGNHLILDLFLQGP